MSEFKEELKQDVIDENGLTHKDNKFLEVLFDECKGNIKDAMKAAGLTGPQHLVTSRLKEKIKEIAQDYLIANTGRAVVSLVNTLDDPNLPGTKNTLTAAGMILDRGGVVKKEEVTVQEQNFMFILPAKEREEE